MMIWTLGVVLLLGATLIYSMLEPPYLYRHRIAVAQMRHPATGRFPASLESRITAVEDCRGCAKKNPDGTLITEPLFPQLAAESFELDLPCLSSSPKADPRPGSQIYVPASAKQVRLKAVSCKSSDTFEDVEINNSSNGFMATVFQPTVHSLLTDYMTLAKSMSIVRVTYTTADGDKLSRDFQIERAPAAWEANETSGPRRSDSDDQNALNSGTRNTSED